MLKYVEPIGPNQFEGIIGYNISACAIEVLSMAKILKQPQTLKFNDKILNVYPEDDIDMVQDRWEELIA